MMEGVTKGEDGHYYDEYGNWVPAKIVEGQEYGDDMI